MKREISILKYLIQKQSFTTIDELAQKYKVSTRSIRKDLKTIEESLQNSSIQFKRDRKKGNYLRLSNE